MRQTDVGHPRRGFNWLPTADTKREGKAGIRVYVVELGGSGSSEQLHRISAKFRPAGEHVIETEEDSGRSSAEYGGERVTGANARDR
jgi:hypothetical protein